MPVPKQGDFKMFGTGSNQTIQGAIIQGGGDGDNITRFSGSAQNIGRSNINKYDTDFAGNVTAKSDISSSEQWRGYPISTSYNFAMKCEWAQSQSIADPIPNPNASGSIMCFGDIQANSIGFNNSGVGFITGSSGANDNTYPVSSSYNIIEFSNFVSSFNRVYLQITTGSDTNTPPTFTSLTITSSAGENTLNYCDLENSSSNSAGLFTYQWEGSSVSNHFTVGNCVTLTFNTSSVDYFVDCDPAISTTGATRTIGHIQQDKQLSCDTVTIDNIYFSSSDLTDGITVGDYVYTDSDGRNPFDGQSKFWGINTSSAPSLNSVPDKICQIVSNGLITAISDCTPTPAPVLPTASVIYDCDTTSNKNYISLSTSSYAGSEYLVYNISSDSEVTQSFGYTGLSDRPNKFTLFDSSGSYDDPIYTTGWVGSATYTNTAGKDQWSNPLDVVPSGSAQIKWKSSTGRKVRVDYGRANPSSLSSDEAKWCLVCSGSLTFTNLATGSTIVEACRSGSIGDDLHYHYHPTSSFSDEARVYYDNNGLNHVTSSAQYFSYTGSAGTRYYYRVQSGYFGEITQHSQCPGPEIAAVHLTNAGDDCDSSDTLLSNRLYIDSSWSGFTTLGGKLVVDNTSLGIASQTDQDIYNNEVENTIDPQSISSALHSVGKDGADNTFLVAQNSLKDTSAGHVKILATVNDSTTPSTVAFTPCSAFSGGSGCTEFDASNGFYDNSFSGNNPVTAGMCSGDEFPGALFIAMSGLIPQAGDGVHTSAACSGNINAPNTYYTIYNGVMNKTFIIKMNADGDEIAQVWECGASDVPSSGDNSYYLSTSFTDYGDNCGQDYIVSNAVTSDAPSIALGLHYTVYDNGARFNGRNKYYIVKTSSQTASGNSGQSHRFWQIDSNGVVQDVALQTCGGSGGSE